MAERTGLVATVEEAGGGNGAYEDADQLAMELGLDLPAERRGRGRPAGRRNLRNQRVADFVLAQVGDPLLTLARFAAMGVDDIAAALHCSRHEAWQEKRLAAVACLPFTHQRQAIAVDVTTRAPVFLTMVLGGDDGGPAGSNGIIDIVENQQVSEADHGTV